jgi:hypothetical protein
MAVTLAQIGAALKSRFATLGGLPVAWPNVDFKPALTGYIAFSIEHAPVTRLGFGTWRRHGGTIVATIATGPQTGSGAGDAAADSILALFAADTLIALPSGDNLRITDTPSVRGGYRDDAYWRTPITIPFEVLSGDSTVVPPLLAVFDANVFEAGVFE